MRDTHSQDSQVEASIRDLLIQSEGKLTEATRDAIMANRDAVIPALLAVMADEELQRAEAPGKGMAPVVAAGLLGQLEAVQAAEPMLVLLADCDPLEYLYSALIHALQALGRPVLERALRAYERTDVGSFRESLEEVLSGLNVRDDRIYQILITSLRENPERVAGMIATYGDERALPVLHEVFRGLEVSPKGHWMSNQVFIEVKGAIRVLGGALDADEQKRYEVAMRPYDEFRARMQRAFTPRKHDRPSERKAQRTTSSFVLEQPKVGRNQPCPCGSGKKYKKCCLH